MTDIERPTTCTCGPWHPDHDGPQEDCPQHGREYSEWVEIAYRKGARVTELEAGIRALADEWERFHYENSKPLVTLLGLSQELRALLYVATT